MKMRPHPKSLTERMLMYQATGEKYSELHEQTAVYIYDYLQRLKHVNEDIKSDFFLALYPSFDAMIKNFRYSGIPFEHYVVFIAKKRIKSFIRKAQRNSFLWTMFQTPGFEILQPQSEPGHSTGDTTDFSDILQINKEGKITDPAAKKRFLCFALKQSRHHTDDEIGLIARITDYPPEWIREKVDVLKDKLSQQEHRHKNLTRRRNRLFISIRCLEYKVNHECDPEKRKELSALLFKKKATLAFVADAIRHIPLAPTHQEIAAVLEIPKGTVDIQMFRLKKRIKTALQTA
ncbi:MAG: hypothetical protein JW904_04270 [Spirochaetales bacterium]|nr:hypothetical protein [Spirochaetales bacterium]